MEKYSIVVYRTIPTSNHNSREVGDSPLKLYIVLFLHQTTTILILRVIRVRCISYYSYIKPQLVTVSLLDRICCISYYSYIKPQLIVQLYHCNLVVYRTIPTSNHNAAKVYKSLNMLYIVLFLHQTTTDCSYQAIYRSCISYYSYIKPQHRNKSTISLLSCISYYSYIKPQPWQVSP